MFVFFSSQIDSFTFFIQLSLTYFLFSNTNVFEYKSGNNQKFTQMSNVIGPVLNKNQ